MTNPIRKPGAPGALSPRQATARRPTGPEEAASRCPKGRGLDQCTTSGGTRQRPERSRVAARIRDRHGPRRVDPERLHPQAVDSRDHHLIMDCARMPPEYLSSLRRDNRSQTRLATRLPVLSFLHGTVSQPFYCLRRRPFQLSHFAICGALHGRASTSRAWQSVNRWRVGTRKR